MISIESGCGCSFTIVRGASQAPVLLRLEGGDVSFSREIRTNGDGEIEELASFLHSCVLAIEDDARDGQRHVNLCDRSYYCDALDLDTELEVLDSPQTTVRLRFTLILPEEAPLAVCHLGVVLDVTPDQLRTFVAGLVAGLPRCPDWWSAA